jgi:tetrahydromethanopterin S-methyltransferase subunit A
MLKVKPSDGYPPEESRYVRGNDYSPVAVCVILDTFDFAIPVELNGLVMTGVDSGAALSGMLQTENIGMKKKALHEDIGQDIKGVMEYVSDDEVQKAKELIMKTLLEA